MNENEYGWLLIDTPEKKQKYGPRKKGDQWTQHDCPEWYDDSFEGSNFDIKPINIYRRPLVPPSSDWELVGLDEVVQKGDEIFDLQYNEWREWLGDADCTAKKAIGSRDYVAAFRRRKRQPQPASNWISVKERLPENYEYPVWVTDGHEVKVADCNYGGEHKLPCSKFGTIDWDKTITHFCPKPKQEPPPLPVGEGNVSEQQFEAWDKEYFKGLVGPEADGWSWHKLYRKLAWDAAWSAYAALQLQQKATK